MALVPAQIPVSWLSNYAGPHRVCYRIVGAPSYICTVPGTPGPGFHPVCAGGGTPCNYNIDILVDNETCDTINYEGYIQAACETDVSLNGRIPFNISFVPSPACVRYSATCIDSGVLDATINSGGSGYSDGFYPALPTIGGGGVGATFDVTVVGTVITIVALAAAGSGYTSAPIVDISSIVFAPGDVADISVNLVGCGDLSVFDCISGLTGEVLPTGTFQPGEAYEMCKTGDAPSLPVDFTLAIDGNCLCNCTQLSLTEDEPGGTGSLDYTYIDCNGAVQTGTVATGATFGPICMVTGSLTWIVVGNANGTVTVGAACDAV